MPFILHIIISETQVWERRKWRFGDKVKITALDADSDLTNSGQVDGQKDLERLNGCWCLTAGKGTTSLK